MKNLASALLRFGLPAVLAFAAFAPLAQAQFTGDFALTPPGTGVYTTDNNFNLWTLVMRNSANGDGSLNTTNAPASFTLSGVASGLTTFGGCDFFIMVPNAGTLSFDYNFTPTVVASTNPSSAQFVYFLNEDPTTFTTSHSGTVNLTVEPSNTLGFKVRGFGGQDFVNDPDSPFFTPTTGTGTVTISNFSFTPAAVPEPGVYAWLLGLGSLGLVGLRRRFKW